MLEGCDKFDVQDIWRWQKLWKQVIHHIITASLTNKHCLLYQLQYQDDDDDDLYKKTYTCVGV